MLTSSLLEYLRSSAINNLTIKTNPLILIDVGKLFLRFQPVATPNPSQIDLKYIPRSTVIRALFYGTEESGSN